MSFSAPTLLSVPGKTFLLGEYVALDGGPSLLLSTSPRFEMTFVPKTSTTSSTSSSVSARAPFADASPAGRYLAKHKDLFNGFEIGFNDPHEGRGGLGASSAQFALLWAFANPQAIAPGPADGFPWAEILRDYASCAWSGEGTPPSGADIVSQLSGGLTWFNGRECKSETLSWTFETLGFTLIRTGHKLATHEHLKTSAQAPHGSLRTVVLEGRKAIDTSDDMRLIEAVNAAAHILRESNLTAARTLGLLETMRSNSELFFAVKGSGAMGADVILALHESDKTQVVADFAKDAKLEICGTHLTLSRGLEKTQTTESR